MQTDNEKSRYFNLCIEMDARVVDDTIQTCIASGRKGYVCCMEANNITVANRVPEMREAVNASLINTCDGSNVAMVLGKIHHRHFHSYVGADVFRKYLSMCKYRHMFLGNTAKVLDSMKQNISAVDPAVTGMQFNTLPFVHVDEFDYQAIAEQINNDNPDIVWVSLGAPKQELFMARLLPYINRGVLVGVGAVFNFYSSVGGVTRAPRWMIRLHLEWLHRAIEQPKKNIPRYWNFVKILPRLIKEERKRVKQEIC